MQRRKRKIKVPVVAREVKSKKNIFLIPAVIVTAVIVIVFVYIHLSRSTQDHATQVFRKTDAGQTQGNMMLELRPAEATKNTTIQLAVKGFDASAAQYEWTIDGTPVTVPDQMAMSLADEPWAQKGAVIRAKAIIGGSEIVSNEVRIANSPVQVTAVGFVDQVRPGEPLSVKAEAVDPDEDEIRYEYAWTVNGAAAGTTDQLDRKTRRGDRILVQVTACDNEGGCSSRSAERIINNMPPEIDDSREFRFENDIFEYQVKASDSDGDQLAFALDSSPAGVVIDPKTGFIRWQVPRQVSGKQRISIVVTDGQGGVSTYQLEFTPQ